MDIKCIKTGYLEENCYIISKEDNCLVVDPGDDASKIIDEIGEKTVLGVLITHYHFDHIGALDELKERYNVEVIDYKNRKNLIGNFNFEIIDTKGHKEDAVSYYFKEEKIMFVGDFIFEGTIGRCDLSGGNFEEMKKSLFNLKQLDKNIILYPGHGNKTTIERELLNNPYLRSDIDE